MGGLNDGLGRRQRARTVHKNGLPPSFKTESPRPRLTVNSSVDWVEYWRRVSVRERRRLEVRLQAGWSGHDARKWALDALEQYQTHKKG